MDQPSIYFQNNNFEKNSEKKETSKFLKTFENSNKETEDEEENSNDYLETFLPKDLFKESNINEEEKIFNNKININNEFIKKEEENKNNIKVQAKINFFATDVQILIKQMKTYKGSIYLQNLLSLIDDSDIQKLLIKLSPNLTEVMCSHYGNYFIQKFFQRLNYQQRLFILNIIQNNFLDICIDKSGTHSIQAFIDSIKTPLEEKIIENLLNQNLLLLFCNENSHHIIQKIIIDYPEYKRGFLNNFILTNLNKICNNLYGSLCVIKFIIMNNNIYIRFQLLNSIQILFFNLVMNKYGCSILFFLLEKYGIEYCYFIINFIKHNFEFLISQSNSLILIEKVLNYIYKFANNEYNEIIWMIIKNDNLLYLLIENDLYHRIISLIIKTLNEEQKDILRKKMKDYLHNDKNLKEKLFHLVM